MKTQLQKLGLGMMFAVLPMMATSVSAQWTQQQNQATSVVVHIGDSDKELPTVTKGVHTVGLTDNGTLIGQIASIDANTKSSSGLKGVNVFFVQNGEIVKQAQTLADGSFEIQNMPEGAFSFFAAGNAGFAASGVTVTGQVWGDNDLLEASLASADYSGIQEIINRNVPAEIRQALNNANQREIGSVVETSNQVRLINGRITGQINSLSGQSQNVSGIQIHLIQNNKPVAQVQTNSDGQFIIPDITPGVYDFVAAGNTSFVVGRFEAIGNSRMVTQISFRKTATKLEFALTQPMQQDDDDPIVFNDGANVLMETGQGTTEFFGESVGLGGAGGGSAGTVGNFSNVGGPVIRGGARLGRGGAARRLLFLGGVGGIIGGTVGNPSVQSPVNGN